uniref:SAM domain-containing protein n=1 Tax=Timema tahoe TaxID=61484 RepID=A0A7R9ICP4_9NEOP|nr:unnamed protein product [Timema tahoe]
MNRDLVGRPSMLGQPPGGATHPCGGQFRQAYHPISAARHYVIVSGLLLRRTPGVTSSVASLSSSASDKSPFSFNPSKSSLESSLSEEIEEPLVVSHVIVATKEDVLVSATLTSSAFGKAPFSRTVSSEAASSSWSGFPCRIFGFFELSSSELFSDFSTEIPLSSFLIWHLLGASAGDGSNRTLLVFMMKSQESSAGILAAFWSSEINSLSTSISSSGFVLDAIFIVSCLEENKENMNPEKQWEIVSNNIRNAAKSNVGLCKKKKKNDNSSLCPASKVALSNAEEWTPLMYACSRGHQSTVRMLLEYDPWLDTSRAFVMAVRGGHIHLLPLLLQRWTLRMIDHQHWTPLAHAAHMGQLECANYIIQHGGDVNAWLVLVTSSRELLYLGVSSNASFLVHNTTVVTSRSDITGGSVLMTTSIVVTYRSVVTGESVLMTTNTVVTYRSDITGGSVLMTTNIVVTYRSDITGESVLMTTNTVVTYRSDITGESVLMTTNIVVTYRSDITGESVLMVAVKCGRVEVVKLLLNHGADPTFISKDGRTALSVAETVGNIELVNCLWDAVFEKTDLLGSIPGASKLYLWVWNEVKLSLVRTSVELSKFLDFLNLRKYYPVFLSYHIDMRQLLMLSDQDLKHIGLSMLGPRKKIAMANQRWRHFILKKRFATNTRRQLGDGPYKPHLKLLAGYGLDKRAKPTHLPENFSCLLYYLSFNRHIGMAWRSHGRDNADMIRNLKANGIIRSQIVEETIVES